MFLDHLVLFWMVLGALENFRYFSLYKPIQNPAVTILGPNSDTNLPLSQTLVGVRTPNFVTFL